MNHLTRRSLLGAVGALTLGKTGFASQSAWPGALVMGTGQPSGAFTIFGPAWGRLITHETGVRTVYTSTDGSSANLLLIEEGQAQLGLCSLPVAIQARTGTGTWTAGAKLRQFRVLFPAFPSILQIVSTVDGVSTLTGLEGRPIGIGPADASPPTLIKTVLLSQGIAPSQIQEGRYAHQLAQLLNGELAACAFFGAPPIPALRAIASSNRLRLIGFSEAEANQATHFMPGLTRMILKAETFPGQTTDVGSVGTQNLAIGTAALPNALAEAATLAALQHRAQLAAIVPAALQPLPLEQILAAGLPIHAGAARAMRHLGYKIPKAAIS